MDPPLSCLRKGEKVEDLRFVSGPMDTATNPVRTSIRWVRSSRNNLTESTGQPVVDLRLLSLAVRAWESGRLIHVPEFGSVDSGEVSMVKMAVFCPRLPDETESSWGARKHACRLYL